MNKPENLTPEDDFIWEVCAHLVAKGVEEAIPVYTDKMAGPTLTDINCDGTVVPVGVEMRAGRPHFWVNRVGVLRGAAISKKTLNKCADAVIGEKVNIDRQKAWKDSEEQAVSDMRSAEGTMHAGKMTVSRVNWSAHINKPEARVVNVNTLNDTGIETTIDHINKHSPEWVVALSDELMADIRKLLVVYKASLEGPAQGK